MDKPFFPVFIDLSDKNIVVIGAGNIAGRRIDALSSFTDNITVIAPRVSERAEDIINRCGFTVKRKAYEKEDIINADMVLAATDDPLVNKEIHADCREKGIPVNVCSDKEMCDFYFPGIIRNKDIVIGVSTGGKDHAKARRVTEKIRGLLEDG